MPKKDRAKARSGKFTAERHFTTPEIEAARRLERTEPFPVVSSDALAARRYVAEALDIVDEIYRTYGLPPFPGRVDELFAQFEGSNDWVPYQVPVTREDVARSDGLPQPIELQPWWALGYAAFGHDSEPGFASDIAVAVPDVSKTLAKSWMPGFRVGYWLATTVWRWRVEYDMRGIVNLKQPESTSRGGLATAADARPRRQAKERHWQGFADDHWKAEPSLSKSTVAKKIEKQVRHDAKFRGRMNTIRQVIKAPTEPADKA